MKQAIFDGLLVTLSTVGIVMICGGLVYLACWWAEQ